MDVFDMFEYEISLQHRKTYYAFSRRDGFAEFFRYTLKKKSIFMLFMFDSDESLDCIYIKESLRS